MPETVPDTDRSDQPIHHLALPDDWAAAFASGEYRMSTRGMTIDDVGYMHCSTRAQIEATANRFYADVDQLVILTIDPQRVGAAVVFEPPAPGIDEPFPHIYGPLPIAAVVDTKFWIRTPPAPWSLD